MSYIKENKQFILDRKLKLDNTVRNTTLFLILTLVGLGFFVYFLSDIGFWNWISNGCGDYKKTFLKMFYHSRKDGNDGIYFSPSLVFGYFNQLMSLSFLVFCSVYVIKKEALKLQEVKVEAIFLDELERVRTFNDKVNWESIYRDGKNLGLDDNVIKEIQMELSKFRELDLNMLVLKDIDTHLMNSKHSERIVKWTYVIMSVCLFIWLFSLLWIFTTVHYTDSGVRKCVFFDKHLFSYDLSIAVSSIFNMIATPILIVISTIIFLKTRCETASWALVPYKWLKEAESYKDKVVINNVDGKEDLEAVKSWTHKEETVYEYIRASVPRSIISDYQIKFWVKYWEVFLKKPDYVKKELVLVNQSNI